ncbi:MAG: TlpA disulfide reductase family protein [Enhygromyxa sp.]
MRLAIPILLSLALLGCDGATQRPAEGSGIALFRLPEVGGDEVEVVTEPGGRTVLTFWATWCQPCQSELSELDRVYAELRGRGLRVYAINVDDPSTASQVGSWVAREGYSFPVLLDTESEILARYHPRKEVPYYVVLDGDARVVEDRQGYTPGDIDALRTRLEQALAE